MLILIKNARIIDSINLEEFEGYLVVGEKRIQEVNKGNPGFALEKSCDKVIDARGLYLVPAFIDIQINGLRGNSFSDPKGWIYNVEAIWSLVQDGLGAVAPTIITSSKETTKKALREICEVKKRYPDSVGKLIVAVHLEGPFISKNPAAVGCHPEAHIRQPDIFEYQKWREIIEAVLGSIVAQDFPLIITLAPELKGAEYFMSGVKKRDNQRTIFMVGHSDAQVQHIENSQRFLSGATHLWNAYRREIDKKDLRYPGEVLVNKKLWITGITCSHHFPDKNTLIGTIRAKGIEKFILVTDAMEGAGMPDGDYVFSGQRINVENRAAWKESNQGGRRLAGSTLLMNQAVFNAHKIFGFSLVEAVQMASYNPARFLGLEQEMGTLEQGKKANLVLCSFTDQELVVQLTMLEGELVYQNPSF